MERKRPAITPSENPPKLTPEESETFQRALCQGLLLTLGERGELTQAQVSRALEALRRPANSQNIGAAE